MCQNHSVDDAVCACTKGLSCEEEQKTAFTPYKRKEERGKRRTQLMHQARAKDNLLPWGARDAKELSDAWVHIQPH
jgi:hypothetical protein